MKNFHSLNLYSLNDNFMELKNLFINKKLPNKMILSGPKGIGKATLSYHFINYVLSLKENDSYNLKQFCINPKNRSFILMNNLTHPNFHLIDLQEGKISIDISQIRSIVSEIKKSNFNDLPRFVMIDNAELLNKNSVNALLKIIEEPNFNVCFILIQNSNYKMLDTLRSRCYLFKVRISHKDTIKIVNNLHNIDIYKKISNELINFYFTPRDFLFLLKISDDYNIDLSKYSLNNLLKLILEKKVYKKNNEYKEFFYRLTHMYIFKYYKKKIYQSKFYNAYLSILKKIKEVELYNLDTDNFLIEFKKLILNEK